MSVHQSAQPPHNNRPDNQDYIADEMKKADKTIATHLDNEMLRQIDNQADWISDLLSKDYLTDVHGKITGFILEEGNLDSRVDAHAAITTKIAEERIDELKKLMADYAIKYQSAAEANGLDREVPYTIFHSLAADRIAELEAALRLEE